MLTSLMPHHFYRRRSNLNRDYCIGAALAKMEIRLVLEELTRHYPSLRLEPGQDLLPVPNFMLRTYQEMVLTIDESAQRISIQP